MFSVKRGFNQIFKFGVGLGLGVSSRLLVGLPVLAAPAPVFEPILEDLSTAPIAHPIRLPNSVPSDVELYPSATQHFGILVLRLVTAPDCEDVSCLGLNIAVTAEPPYWPPPGDDTLTPVGLGNDIQGYSSEGGGFGAVQWVQDGSLYALSYKMDMFSLEDAIAMATSMVSEPPVTTPSQ